MTITGTANFKTLAAAVKYYAEYDYTKADVQRKIAEGEIHIGQPETKQGETLTVDVDGRYMLHSEDIPAPSKIVKSQKIKFGPKPIKGYGPGAEIVATVRYDDQYGNGHNSFSITADVTTPASRRRNDIDAGGCLHEDIVRIFPELAPYIKWHLFDSTGPMHYIANTCYHASNRDYRGLLAGEKKQLVNGRTKLPVWQRVVRDENGNEVKMHGNDWKDSETAPVETLTVTWEPVWTIGEGKARELGHARSTAVWPDATDEDLTAPGLEERLKARLPQLLKDFRAAVESLGLVY